MPEDFNDAIQTLVGLGRQTDSAKSVPGGNVPYVVIPATHKLETLERFVFNDHADHPARTKAVVAVLDPESFINYYQLFGDENSRVFAYEPDIKVTAVIDYHGAMASGPRWCQHRLVLTLRESEQWKVWVGANNKKFPQAEFAEFLEQNAIDITKPSPAGIMEIARDLQGTTEVEFGAGVRMNDGSVRFKYTEATKATVGGDAVSVPERFTIGLPVFIGGAPVTLEALLRYRVNGGKLQIFYTLVRPEEAKRAAFIASRAQIADDLKVTVINGKPQD